jgi:hypothetical protein
MHHYSMRVTWPDEPDRRDDFVFRVDGKDAGRCYQTIATMDRGWVWRWAVYGTSKGGMEDTLEDAQAKFKIEYEKCQAS